MQRNRPTEPPKRAIPRDHFRVLHWDGVFRVLDAKGRDVPGVIAADVAMRPGIPPLMRINLAAGNFDTNGVPAFGMLDPRVNKFRPIRRVEFADGGDDFVPDQPPAGGVPSAPPVPPATSAPETETLTGDAAKPAEG